MKLKFLAIPLFMLIALSSASARSATISQVTDLGTASAPWTYMTDTGVSTYSVFDIGYRVVIPTMTSIRFDYTLLGVSDPDVLFGSLKSIGTTLTGPTYSVIASTSAGFPGVSNHSADNLVLATADLSTPTSGYTILTNKTAGNVFVESSLLAVLMNGASLHVMASLSAVPLPAALPLFGVAVASLAGVAARRRKQVDRV